MPEIAYESVPNFLKFPPNIYLGEGIGVATNSKGHVFVYTRSGDTRLFEFDQNGAYVREIGAGLYGFTFAHAVRVDKDDNIWTVDEGSNMVIKFNPAGRVVMVIGRRPDAVDELVAMSGQGIGAAPEQAVLVQPSDRRRLGRAGQHLRHRRLRRRSRGEVRQERPLHQVGRHRAATARRSCRLPHTMAMDAAGNIYIGDRSNARVQVWDNDLNPKAIYDQVGSPWAVCISPGPHQYLFVSNSVPDNGDSRAARADRRDLQDGARRHDHRQVRQGRKGAEGVQHRARDRLPQPERTLRLRDHRLAGAEDLLKPQAMKSSGGR